MPDRRGAEDNREDWFADTHGEESCPCRLLVVVLPMPARAQAAPSLARCLRPIEEFDRYFSRIRETGTSGPMLDRQIAEVKCRGGDVAEGTRLVEGALQRNRIPLPPD